jgi:beta-glucosidase
VPSTNFFRCNTLLILLAVVSVGVSLAPLQSSAQERAPYQQPVKPSNAQLVDPQIERRVSDLLGRMTLDEKIGQLVQYSASQAPTTGPTTAALNVNPPGPNGVDSY